MVTNCATGPQHTVEDDLHATGMFRAHDQTEQFLTQGEKASAGRFRHRRHRNLQGVEQIV